MPINSSSSNKIIRIITFIYSKAISFIFTFIIMWLFLLSINSTSIISSDANEYTYYTNDNPLLHIFLFLLFLGVIYLLTKLNLLDYINNYLSINTLFFTRLKYTFLIIICVISLLWLLITQTNAGADQFYVLDAAYKLRTGDTSPFIAGGYIYKYPNQIGLLCVEYLLGFIVGDYNYIFWQLLNVFMIVYIYKLFLDIMNNFNMPRLSQICILLIGTIFIPLTFYAPFVYGNIAGLFFSILSFKYANLYISNKKISHALISGFSIMFAIIVKQNYIIFMIALIIYLLAECIRQNKAYVLILLSIIFTAYIFQAFIPKYYLEQKSGCILDSGASSWTWIAMGLHTISSDYYADGWYDSTIASHYEDNNYDTELEAIQSKNEINEYLSEYITTPSKGISFISHKVASQWNNPEFQCLWITNVRYSYIKKSNLVENILSIKGRTYIINFLNIIHSFILLGSLFYGIELIYNPKLISTLFFPITFIGGFIFHLFWEGKCQYTLPYFVLLIPISIIGYYLIYKKIKNISYHFLIKCGIFIILLLTFNFVFNRLTVVNNSNDKYQIYLNEINNLSKEPN